MWKKYSHIAIMGDFNLRNINWEHYSCPGENLEDCRTTTNLLNVYEIAFYSNT